MTGLPRHRPPAALALLLAALTALPLAACSPDPTPPGPAAVPTPLPSAEPTAAPTTEPSEEPAPTPDPDPSPSPTPSPSEEPVGDRSQGAALAAASAQRATMPGCDDGDFTDGFDAVVAEYDEGLLTFVACFAGAYQVNGRLMLFDGVELAELEVEQYSNGLVVTDEVVGELAELDDGRVENLTRYRGLGDCGLLQLWEFVDGRLVLVEAREQQCSDDGEFVPPQDWPLVYEA